MIVAGFEFTSTTSYPSARKALQACVPEQSNSQACPIMIGPEPMIMIFLMSVRFGIRLANSAVARSPRYPRQIHDRPRFLILRKQNDCHPAGRFLAGGICLFSG